MAIDRLLNQGAEPALEQVLKFTSAREKLLANDVANIDTPGFVQRDLSVQKFQSLLSDHLDAVASEPRGTDIGEINVEEESTSDGILFHDRNNRSVEQLMSDGMKNALTHNLMIELLKRQFATMELALQQK